MASCSTEDGRGQFALERAAVSGIPIPKSFLQELLSYYSRTDDYPNGINIDDPFDLPAEIRRIDVAPAERRHRPVAVTSSLLDLGLPSDCRCSSEGRRPAQSGRFEAGGSASRSRTCCSGFLCATRTAAAAADSAVKPGQTVAVSGEVLHASLQTDTSRRLPPVHRAVQDASGQIQAVWPNQAFLKDVIRAHQQIVLYGKAEHWGSRGLQITDPEFEIIRDGDPGDETRPCTPGASSPSTSEPAASRPTCSGGWSGTRSPQLPADLFDPVPADIATREGWPARLAALRDAHFPPPARRSNTLNAFQTPAQRRLIFEDFFVFQLGLAVRRHENAQVHKALVSSVDDRIRSRRARCCRSS